MTETNERREKFLEMLRAELMKDAPDPDVEELYSVEEEPSQEFDEKDFVHKMLNRGFRS